MNYEKTSTNSKSIYIISQELEIERKKLKRKLELLENEKKKLQSHCKHEIVLKLDDHKHHKIGELYHYLCPSCGKNHDIHAGNNLDKSEFANSKVIDLTKIENLDVETYENIVINIHKNYDYYYSDRLDNEQLSQSLYEIIKNSKRVNKK